MKSKTALVEPLESSQAQLLPGVIKTGFSEEIRDLNVLNCSEESVTIYPNTTIGICISVSENEPVQMQSRNAETSHTNVKQPACEELPEYLNDLFLKSSVNLDENEKNQFKSLLIKYQSVFAKSSDDFFGQS